LWKSINESNRVERREPKIGVPSIHEYDVKQSLFDVHTDRSAKSSTKIF